MSKKKQIAIVGRPGVGKTTLAEKIAKELGLSLVSSDTYIKTTDFEEVPDKIIEAIKDIPGDGVVVEGVQVSRMLKRGWKPDKVYIVDANTPIQQQHKGLASMNRKNIANFLSQNNEVEVENIENDLRGPA